MTRTIVKRLVGGRDEGAWLYVDDAHLSCIVATSLHGVFVESRLVPTGCVEWRGDTCAEVFVPAGKLALWRAEHDVEGLS